ncbi:MAG: N-acetyltransferase [Anaerolineales bacterium]
MMQIDTETQETTKCLDQREDMVAEKAGVKDVPAMSDLINYFADKELMLPRSQHQIYQYLRDFVVAKDGSTVIGCGALHIVWGDLGEVRSLAVAEDWHGRGVGRCIVEALQREARELGLPRIFTLTYQQKFFERFGFHVVPRESLPHKIWGDCLNCPKFPNCDEIAMILDFEEKEG